MSLQGALASVLRHIPREGLEAGLGAVGGAGGYAAGQIGGGNDIDPAQALGYGLLGGAGLPLLMRMVRQARGGIDLGKDWEATQAAMHGDDEIAAEIAGSGRWPPPRWVPNNVERQGGGDWENYLAQRRSARDFATDRQRRLDQENGPAVLSGPEMIDAGADPRRSDLLQEYLALNLGRFGVGGPFEHTNLLGLGGGIGVLGALQDRQR